MVGFEAPDDRIDNFLVKLEPVVGAIIGASKQDLDKARRKRRRT